MNITNFKGIKFFHECAQCLSFLCCTELPEDQRFEAIQMALMLMPDENREALQVLLQFLHTIAENSDSNQARTHYFRSHYLIILLLVNIINDILSKTLKYSAMFDPHRLPLS